MREAFSKVINYINTLSENIILVAHVKDKMIDKAGAEFSALDIDLTGKIGRITAANSDAIGYMHRVKGTQNYISFMTSDEISCGSRSAHIRTAAISIMR